LETRPIDLVISEVAEVLGVNADLPAKLRIIAPGVKKLPKEQRKAMNAAIGAEVERLSDGVVSAPEWQRLNPGSLTPLEAMFQEFLDSQNEKTIHEGMRRLLNKETQTVLASSPSASRPLRDPRLEAEFGENYEADEYGMPVIPRTLPDGHPLLQHTKNKKTATIRPDHPLVGGLNPTHSLASGLPADHPALKGGFLSPGEVSRKEFGRAVVRMFLSLGKEIPNDTIPIVYATGGGGGAGKSTILNHLRGSGKIKTDGAVPVNADDIKSLIPEWDEFTKAGDGGAAYWCHEESSQLSKDLLDAVLRSGKYNFAYDATLANTPKAVENFQKWQQAGFQVYFIGVSIDLREAMVRAFLRSKGSGRWVPSSTLVEAHAGFNRGIDSLMEASDLADLYDNTPPDAHPVAEKTSRNSKINIVNQEYYDIIKQRKNEFSKEISNTNQKADSKYQLREPEKSNGSTSNRRQDSDGSSLGTQGFPRAEGSQVTLGSSPTTELDLFAAAFAPEAGRKYGAVKVGRMNALAAYRTLTTKRNQGITLTPREEQQLLDAEEALGQKMAFDMQELKGTAKREHLTTPPPTATSSPRSTQQSLMLGDDMRGQMMLFSSPSESAQFDLFADIAPKIMGPRAKQKANALAQAKMASEKGKLNIFKRVAKMEVLEDPDSFAQAAVKSFDDLFSTMQTQETDKGVMLFSSPTQITSVEEFHDALMAPITEDVMRAEQPKASYDDKRQLLFDFAASIIDPAGKAPTTKAPGMLGDIPIIRQRLANEVAVNLKVQFLGDTVVSPSDLAAKAQALRNPMFETFYVLAAKTTRKGIKIVDAMAITARVPGCAPIFTEGKGWDEGIADHLKFLKNAKADRYFLLHNHPSGDPSASFS
jgi:predicted ABC-type ATPase